MNQALLRESLRGASNERVSVHAVQSSAHSRRRTTSWAAREPPQTQGLAPETPRPFLQRARPGVPRACAKPIPRIHRTARSPAKRPREATSSPHPPACESRVRSRLHSVPCSESPCDPESNEAGVSHRAPRVTAEGCARRDERGVLLDPLRHAGSLDALLGSGMKTHTDCWVCCSSGRVDWRERGRRERKHRERVREGAKRRRKWVDSLVCVLAGCSLSSHSVANSKGTNSLQATREKRGPLFLSRCEPPCAKSDNPASL